MKLFRFGEPGAEKPGVEYAGRRLDLSSKVDEFDGAFFAGGKLSEVRKWLAGAPEEFPEIPEGSRIAPPIARPGKIVCVGLNYEDHAKEFGNRDLPSEPVLFMKATTAYCGPNDPLVRPAGSTKLDYEVELAIVIGAYTKEVAEEDAMQSVAGFTMLNDVSERTFQKEMGGQWVKGKSYDGFASVGPFLVTRDDIADVHSLGLWTDVNGESRQLGNTRDMIFSIPFIVSYISRFMTLEPGDIIASGTPGGVAMGMAGSGFLQPGDVLEMGIDGIGCARRVVESAEGEESSEDGRTENADVRGN